MMLLTSNYFVIGRKLIIFTLCTVYVYGLILVSYCDEV